MTHVIRIEDNGEETTYAVFAENFLAAFALLRAAVNPPDSAELLLDDIIL